MKEALSMHWICGKRYRAQQSSLDCGMRCGVYQIALLFGLIYCSGDAIAQGLMRSAGGLSSGKFIAAPRGVSQQLREAERAIGEERYSDAVVRLGDLLSIEEKDNDAAELNGQDFFLDLSDSGKRGRPFTKSMLRTARKMIADLPPAALETYELRYGALARKELNQAAESRNWQIVRDVRRKYFHTFAGYEASFLLAQHELLEGRALAGSLYLDEVVEAPRAIAHLGHGVLLIHAAACSLSRRDLPEVDQYAGTEVTVNGEITSFPADDQMPNWLAERFGAPEDQSVGPTKEYAVFGARPDRNGASSGELPLSNERWMLDTTSSPLQERSVRKVADELTSSGKLPPPSWVPLRVGDQLLMRTTERLVGVDNRTGKRVWTYPWQSGYELFEDEDSPMDPFSGETDTTDLISQRVWNDVPFGHISSDGERVYVLDNLQEVETAVFNPMINIRGGARPAVTSRNTLVALELATEGKLRWRLGAGAEDASTLSDAFFLGPPLPVDGRLYVMVEIAGDVNLCCLDPESGAEIWRQQLVAVESGGIESDPIRRVAGAMPTYHEGLLICPTGAGAIVAIDLADRTLRWGVNFDRNLEMVRTMTGAGRVIEPSQLMQRWFSGVAVASEQALIVTPIESNRLLGLDVLTGESLFSQRNRVHARYLAGIRDGRFYVVGVNQVRSFDLESGDVVWATDRNMLVAGQHISGLGTFGDDVYLLPTSTNQIVSISLDDGSVVDRRETRFPLGNLVAVDGEVISQSPTALAVAFGEATLEPLVNRKLESNPDDFDALVRKSQLLLQHGQRAEALDLLSRARQMEPDNDEVRMLSVSAMLGTMRESLQVDPEIVETLDSLIDRPSQRVELLALQIRASLNNGMRIDAARNLLQLSLLVASEPMIETAVTNLLDDSSRQCSLDCWISARVAQLAKGASDSELAEVNEMLESGSSISVGGSAGLLKQMLRHFASLDGSEQLRDELASRMLSEQSLFDLERIALGYQPPSDAALQQMSNERLWMLVNAYAAGRMPKDVLRVLAQLDQRETGEEREDELATRTAATAKTSRFQWPRNASAKWEEQSRIVRGAAEPRIATLNNLAGEQFEGWNLISEKRSPFGLRDPKGMPRRVPLDGPRGDNDKLAQVSGGAMVAIMSDGLICVDLFSFLSTARDAVRWQKTMSGDVGPFANRRSAITPFDDQVVRYYLTSGPTSNIIPEFRLGPIMGDRVIVLQGGDLLAIDLLTSETLWRNSAAPRSGAVLCDGERVAVVSPATAEVVFFDMLDGRKLDVQAWEGGEIWDAMGTHVLSYRETDTAHEYDLSLTDPFTNERLLDHRSMGANRSNSNLSTPSAYGRVIGGRYFALLQNDGKALVWDIAEGIEIADLQLPAYPELTGLNLMMLDDSIVLIPKTRVRQLRLPTQSRAMTSDAKYHVTANGLHVVSLTDGDLRWEKVFETAWGCTLTQPAETPLLVLSRTPYATVTPSRNKYIDVMALDIRDGRLVDKTLGHALPRGSTSILDTKIAVQPTLARIMVQFGPQLVTYTFTNESLKSSPTELQPAEGDVE